jgi:cysteine desulfurase
MKKVYLDNASATPIDRKVFAKMLPYLKGNFGNASAIHSEGRSAHKALEDARGLAARTIGAKPENIIFTGSGTESDNLAVFGAAQAYGGHGKHIIVSKIEHKAVLEPARELERRGFEVAYLNVDERGIVNLGELKSALREDTILVSVMYANNEVGTIQPISKIAEIIKDHRKEREIPLFHTDACQAAGALSINPNPLGADLMTLNGSKIYGPKGIGCLYISERVKINPLILGGGQEYGMRSGTENIALAVGFAEALALSEKIRKKESKRLIELRDYFIKSIQEKIPDTRLNGHRERRLPNSISISFGGVEGESAVLMLDKDGISAGTGSACSAADLKPSHVFSAMGLPREHARGSVRFTLGRSTAKKDVDYVLRKLPPIIEKMRKISSAKI